MSNGPDREVAAALTRLGWTDQLARDLVELDDPSVRAARVIARDRGFVVVDDGTGEQPAQVSGRLRHAADAGLAVVPAAGDWVALSGDGSVAEVLPRRGVIARATDAGPDVLAAHVDLLLIAHPLAEDDALARLPRFLALAADGDVPAVILITKADLLADQAQALAEVAGAAGADARALMLSVVTGDGIDAVRAMVPEGSTVALTGPSGAGKSTLVNALLGEDRQATGAVRERDGRGRHVTVRRELITLPGAGVLIDTPGLRSIGVRGGVEDAFPDVAAFAGQCRFRDCAHESEPGCAVRAAIESGELDPERLRASRTLGQEAEYAAAREEELLRRALEGRPRTVDTADRGEHRRRRR